MPPKLTQRDFAKLAELAGLPPLSAVELWRVAPPPEAEHLSSLSWDTLEREYPEYVIRVSKRRVGMRVAHALIISSEAK